jgi:hypothetical protein
MISFATGGFLAMGWTSPELGWQRGEAEEVRGCSRRKRGGAFSTFLSNHPCSKIIRQTLVDKSSGIVIDRPWDDESVVIIVPEDHSSLAKALNAIRLPERLSAIWHESSGDLEIIYTAFALPDKKALSIDFKFHYKNHSYKCAYGEPSEELIEIAKNTRPKAESTTDFRNLRSFSIYFQRKELGVANPQLGDPICFWIRKIERNEEKLVEMLRTLNFYMGYYAPMTPYIRIHPPKQPPRKAVNVIAWTRERFPKTIYSKSIDDNLLHLWEDSRVGDSSFRFLNAYRIIEHYGSTYVEESIKNGLRKIISTPHILDDVEAASERFTSLMTTGKLHDSQKVDAALSECVSPSALWNYISTNLEFFTTGTQFDGGFKLAALFAGNQQEFETNGIQVLGIRLRDIRNALSHGRDQKTALVITPTAHNSPLLRPWADLARMAAQEVMIYKRYA